MRSKYFQARLGYIHRPQDLRFVWLVLVFHLMSGMVCGDCCLTVLRRSSLVPRMVVQCAADNPLAQFSMSWTRLWPQTTPRTRRTQRQGSRSREQGGELEAADLTCSGATYLGIAGGQGWFRLCERVPHRDQRTSPFCTWESPAGRVGSAFASTYRTAIIPGVIADFHLPFRMYVLK